MKKFYNFRVVSDNRGNDYTPSHLLQNSYPELDITWNDGKVSVDHWLKLGWIEMADADQAKVESMIDFGTSAKLEYITADQAKQYMIDNWYTETANGFELSPANTEMGDPAVYLVI